MLSAAMKNFLKILKYGQFHHQWQGTREFKYAQLTLYRRSADCFI
jgi:hypothetical protein